MKSKFDLTEEEREDRYDKLIDFLDLIGVEIETWQLGALHAYVMNRLLGAKYPPTKPEEITTGDVKSSEAKAETCSQKSFTALSCDCIIKGTTDIKAFYSDDQPGVAQAACAKCGCVLPWAVKSGGEIWYYPVDPGL